MEEHVQDNRIPVSQEREKTLVSWSSGKDSALALYEIVQTGRYEIVALLTTVCRDIGGVSMHQVPRRLVEAQAASMGYPLEVVEFSLSDSSQAYENLLREVFRKFRRQGVASVVSGDLFLEDLRLYREQQLAQTGLKAAFPLWERDTTELAHSFMRPGFKAVITSVDTSALDISFIGRLFDDAFLEEIPLSVDPCGENGEFHTFVFDGPLFRQPIAYKMGEPETLDGRYYHAMPMPA